MNSTISIYSIYISVKYTKQEKPKKKKTVFQQRRLIRLQYEAVS